MAKHYSGFTLENIEAAARSAGAGRQWASMRNRITMDGVVIIECSPCFSSVSPTKAQKISRYLQRAQPSVMLALIERIRELESMHKDIKS